MLVELSVVEQRYQAVLAVIRDGVQVIEVARRFDVSRQAVHWWLRWYEDQGLKAVDGRLTEPLQCAQPSADSMALAGRSSCCRANRRAV
jgi:transposase-like protein